MTDTGTTNPAAPVPGAVDDRAADTTSGRPDTWPSADRGQLIDKAEDKREGGECSKILRGLWR